jgi:CHAT domain-containing protein
VGCSGGGRLAHAVDEARSVAAALDTDALLLEGEATLDALRARAADRTLLHLATHGLYRADAPLFSALRLGDDLLTADDLSGWRLPEVELATLSACETGVTRRRGSDLLGLARAFFRAGVRRLVASRWTVDDASTALLMGYFYRALREGRPVAPALREAQLATLRAHPHPFHWAGFQAMRLL